MGRGCMRTSLRLVCRMALGGCLFSGGSAWAQLADKNALTLAVAKTLAVAAEEEAVKHMWNVVIVMVNDSGKLLYLQRWDETQIGRIAVALQKAQTPVNFKRPSKAFEEALVTKNRTPGLTLRGPLPIVAGVSILVNEKGIGAMGVRGVTSQHEGQMAKAGANALAQILGPSARGEPQSWTAWHGRLAGATGGGLKSVEEADARQGCSTCGLALGQPAE